MPRRRLDGVVLFAAPEAPRANALTSSPLFPFAFEGWGSRFSSCDKSTLMRILADLDRETCGVVAQIETLRGAR